MVDYLAERGFKATLNIIDNEDLAELKRFIKEDMHSTIQLGEPNNHRENAAEKALQTGKDHIVTGMCLTDPAFPIFLWDTSIIPQAELTLNMLRTSCKNPLLLAQTALDGIFDFNRTPLVPPGTRSLAFIDPDSRGTWAPRAEDAWYSGPALEHYRCMLFYITPRNSYRTLATAKLYPRHCKMSVMTPTQIIQQATERLICALKLPHPFVPITQTRRHLTALEDLSNICCDMAKGTMISENGSHSTVRRKLAVKILRVTAQAILHRNQRQDRA